MSKKIRVSMSRLTGEARHRTQTPELADKDALRREFGIARRPRGRRRRLAAEIIDAEDRARRG
ncbi:hypothetical protein [Gordonia malaquae]|uniref:hypothetical protein n=1 Tax=Gordonia malaquae TaxID=410332 RepID=UPI0030FE04EE